jgi:O-antigen/teichoic acid export membrane protein
MLNNIRLFIEQKLKRSNERSANAIKNILASFGIKGVSIVVSLLLVPMTINYVNPTQYGIWLTLSSIVGWFSFFDIGFGNGLRNRFAEAKATGDYAKAQAYVSTTYICLGVIFSVVWLLFFCVNFFIDWSKILNTSAQTAKELSLVALIVFSFFCMQIVLKTINTVLIADQKPAKSAFFDMLGQVLALLIIFILTKTTHGSLLYLALALGFCPVVIMIISSVWFYKYEYSIYKPAIGLFDRKIIKDILSLGLQFFITQVAMLVIYSTSNVIITNVTDPYQVAVYNIAYKYFYVIIMLFSIIQSVMWSAFTDAWAQKDIVWIKTTLKNLKKIWLLLSILAIIFLFASNFVYFLWIGSKIAIPCSLSVLFALFVILGNWSSMWGNILNGLSKLRLQVYICVVKCLCFIPISISLCKSFGIAGVVIAFILITLPDAILLPIQTTKILKGTAKSIWNK